MKTILVLTDFSRNAAHAGRSAAWLAEKTHAGLLLWNCSPKVPVMPAYLGGVAVAEVMAGTEEGQDLLDEAVRDLEDYISSTDGAYKPRLATSYHEGSLEQELQQQLAIDAVEMIVIGSAASNCSADHIFKGSDTFKILEAATCPVLVVPPRAGLDQLEKVVFATDYEQEDLQVLKQMQQLFGVFDPVIEIVHVTLNGDKDEAVIAKEAQFLEQLGKINRQFSYKEIRGKEVTGRLNRISKQTGADLLAMTHHQYALFKRLMTDSEAKKELAHQKIPLLFFPINLKRS
ncbi:universal stress protein [Mucilaginibacter aquariorum]|uniref:Universal stress protein n=1 Tax=Mucilaginibacter aquariorum TaxID=2967225 RepID=A0ABT1T2D3_9SPHI|nr:universal stress protein [Mucilaginibacter aquariorum]MCQ6958729.1 universal stress protein [Mucilaginibacter aquariorum]